MKSKPMTEFENDLNAALCRTARTPARWQATRIHETPSAIASDPLRGNFYGGDYDAVRFFPTGSETPRRTSNLIRNLEKISRRQSKSRSRGRSYAMDSAATRLDPNEPARNAVARLKERASFDKTSHIWWEGLWEYVRKFPVSTKVRDLDQPALTAFLREI